MRKFYPAIAFMFLTSVVSAQDFLGFKRFFRLEIGFSQLTVKQEGSLYVNRSGHNPPLYYEPYTVEDKLAHVGIGIHGWYAWNFGQRSFDRLAYGIETGFHLNTGSYSQSVVSDTGAGTNLRFPVLFSARMGGAIDPASNGRFGIGFAGGAEIIRTSIANEKGVKVLPKIQGLISFKRVMLTLGYYPFGIRSYYLVNGVKTIRLQSGLVEWSFRYSITWYNVKYRKYKTFGKL